MLECEGQHDELLARAEKYDEVVELLCQARRKVQVLESAFEQFKRG